MLYHHGFILNHPQAVLVDEKGCKYPSSLFGHDCSLHLRTRTSTHIVGLINLLQITHHTLFDALWLGQSGFGW